MSRSKSKLAMVITLSALLTIVLALVFPSVCLESQTHISKDFTYIFGFTSTFGGTIVPKGPQLICPLSFNVGAFLALLFVILGSALVFIFDKQISSYVFCAILLVVSGFLFGFSERFVLEANGFISGFTPYIYTSFGTYVSIGMCSIGFIECIIGAYIIKKDQTRRHH